MFLPKMSALAAAVENKKATLTLEDGSIYTGECRRMWRPHGLGEIKYTHTWNTWKIMKKYEEKIRISYVGEVKDGKPNGKGKMTYADGEVYEGEWKDVYEGEWKDGEEDGKGKMTLANGNVHEGDYKDGERHGEGKWIGANGEVYEGDYKDGERHGEGKYTWANGDVYEGDFKYGKINRKGKKTWADGDVWCNLIYWVIIFGVFGIYHYWKSLGWVLENGEWKMENGKWFGKWL